jgi:16S rRNA (adenine1518-N6/adenine1519-N6)-dimethyltransferase
VLDKIMAAANVCKDDYVVEIGPGIGHLTERLAQSAGEVAAVEIDPDMLPVLRGRLAPYGNVRVINEDILKTDLPALFSRPAKVTANLPYYIAADIVMTLLRGEYGLQNLVVMLQKEVAARFCAIPGSKDYGALSVIAGYYAFAEIAANVPRNCFYPRPNVDSAVLRITPKKNLPLPPPEKEFMFRVVKAAFAKRRKTLVNCVVSEGISPSKAEAAKALKSAGFDENARGEALTLNDFTAVAKALRERADLSRP